MGCVFPQLVQIKSIARKEAILLSVIIYVLNNIPFQDEDMVFSPHIPPICGQAPLCGHMVHWTLPLCLPCYIHILLSPGKWNLKKWSDTEQWRRRITKKKFVNMIQNLTYLEVEKTAYTMGFFSSLVGSRKMSSSKKKKVEKWKGYFKWHNSTAFTKKLLLATSTTVHMLIHLFVK